MILNMMEVLQAYSNRGRHYGGRLEKILTVANDPAASSSPRSRAQKSSAKIIHRLTKADKAEITARYSQGASSRQLAETYSVSKTSIVALLREKGISIRYQGINDSQIQEIIQHYAAGASLAATGDTYGVSAETVRNLLMKHGFTLRNPWDRLPQSDFLATESKLR